MRNILVVVDMQNDFIDGTLGTKEAQEIVPYVIETIKNFNGEVLFTRDTHEENYLETQEGKMLPIKHCIRNTPGWELNKDIDMLRKTNPIDKITFGSEELVRVLKEKNNENPIESIVLMGLCTDICVISNALLIKAFLPEVKIIVDSLGCAGVTVESHLRALDAMNACQIIMK